MPRQGIHAETPFLAPRRSLGWVRALVAVLTVVSLTLVAMLWSRSISDVETAERRRLESLAGTTVLALDGRAHESWARLLPRRDQLRTWDDAPRDLRRTHEELVRIGRAAGISTPVYTLRLREPYREQVEAQPDQLHPDAMEFFLTSASEPYWRHVYPYRPSMAPALFGGKTCSSGNYTDKHGTWISAYAPLFGDNARVVALLEVDAPVQTSVLARATLASTHLLGILGCFLGTVLLVAFLLHRSRQREMEAVRLAHVASRTENGVIITDRMGRIEWVNGGFERTTGYCLEEIRGRTPGSVLQGSETDPKVVARIRQSLRQGEPVFEVIRNYRKNGDELWSQVDIRPVRSSSGRVESWISIQSDITKQKSTEALLEQARDQALENGRVQSEFLSNMGHELRTPLNGILGTTELLLAGDLAPEQKEFCETSLRSGRRLLQIINELLEYAGLQAGNVEVDACDYSPPSLVREALGRHRAVAELQGLAIDYRIDEAVPSVLSGDPRRLLQVLSILIDNAIKFTDQGSVEVIVEARGDRLRFSVEDSGIGIPLEKRQEIFQIFRQGDGTNRRLYGGTGLGLALARKIVEVFEGEIDLESEPGHGSTFWFEIPMVPASGHPESNPAEEDRRAA